MVYKEKFVVVIKYNGKILREKDDVVTLPFGSNYSILLKNLESRRSCVNISIDGQDVLNGSSIVIEPNCETELQGFLENNIVKNRFKFIQKTQQIQEFRGDKIDDGIVRVEYAFEEVKPVERRTIIHEDHNIYRRNYYPFYPDWSFLSSSVTVKDNLMPDVQYSNNLSLGNVSNTISFTNSINVPLVDEGITVKGDETRQDFYSTTIKKLDPSNVITIKLRGITSKNEKVIKPVTVKTRLTCPTCGKKSRSSSKFCSNCGTFLE